MHKIMLMLFAVLFLAGSVAATTMSDFNVGINTEAPGNLTGEWKNVCAEFSWSGTSDADFNNYVVQTTSNVAEHSGYDYNTTQLSATFCTLAPGEWVEMIVYRVDGNSQGYYRNVEPNAGLRITAGTLVDAGMWMFYSILAAFASLITLIIIVLVYVLIVKKTGLDNIIKFK